MESTTINVVISGVVGLVAGSVGSLVAPWIHWGVEQKRLRSSRRVDLIQQWRKVLSEDEFDRKDLLNHPSYGSLRELLQEQVRKELERPETHITVIVNGPPTNSHDRDLLLREIARIEKLWKLL